MDDSTPLPPDVAAMLELAAHRMGFGKGLDGGLELRFSPDGTIRKWTRLDEGGRDKLARFNEDEV